MSFITGVEIIKPKTDFVVPTTTDELLCLSERMQTEVDPDNNSFMGKENIFSRFNIENGEVLFENPEIQGAAEEEHDYLELINEAAIACRNLEMNYGDDTDNEPVKFEMDLNMMKMSNLIELCPGIYQCATKEAADDGGPQQFETEFTNNQQFISVVDVQDTVDYEEEIDYLLPIQKYPEPDDGKDDGKDDGERNYQSEFKKFVFNGDDVKTYYTIVVDEDAKHKRSKRNKKKVTEEE